MMKRQILLVLALMSESAYRASANRVVVSHDIRQQQGTDAKSEVFQAAPGVLLDHQYALIELIGTSLSAPQAARNGSTARDGSTARNGSRGNGSNGSNGSLLEKEKQWPKGFEALGRDYGSTPRLAGQGGFGEVWLAKDVNTGKDVAIKLFKDGKGGYIHCGAGSAKEREELEEMLELASEECQLAQSLMNGREARDDPVGSSHIAQCLVDAVKPNLHTRSPKPCYLVLENGGSSLSKWVESHKGKKKNDPRMARVIVKQLLEAVGFMNSFRPAYIHHDLKPDNIVFSMVDGLPFVKLIDWGCAIRATNQYQWSAVDLRWAPPEYAKSEGRRAFSSPSHSFDMFHMGLIYLDLLCPDVKPDEEKPAEVVDHGVALSANAKVWFEGELSDTYIRSAGCCVDDNHPDSCITAADIELINSMLARASDRPNPNKVLRSKAFQDLMIGKRAGGEISVADAKPMPTNKATPAVGKPAVAEKPAVAQQVAGHGSPDAPWCAKYVEKPDFFTNYCRTWSAVRRNCKVACKL